MKTTTLRAHFDGEHIRLEEPLELRPGTRLSVIVLPEEANADTDAAEWALISSHALEAAYGEEEPEYPLDLIKEPNPEYERG